MKIDQSKFAAMGVAALLPGMRHVLEIVEGVVAEYRGMLDELQAASGNGAPPAVRRGRPPKIALLAAPAAARPTLPEMVGANYTTAGAARELGITKGAARLRAHTRGLGKFVPHPKGRGARVFVLTPADVRAMGQPSGKPAGNTAHPRHPEHPGHAAWVRKIQAARQRAIKAKQEASA